MVRKIMLIIVITLILLLVVCLVGVKLISDYFHPPASITAGAEGIYAELWVSDRCPTVGETVTVRATAVNQSSSPLVVELMDQPVLDIVLGDLDGQHRWSEGKPLTSDLTHLELEPGQSKSIEMPWMVKRSNYFGVYANFIPNAQYIEHPISPSMGIGDCSFIGP